MSCPEASVAKPKAQERGCIQSRDRKRSVLDTPAEYVTIIPKRCT
jgi:hypothetical protein